MSEALDYDTNLKVKSNFKTFFFAFGRRFAAYVSKAEPGSIAHFLRPATDHNKNFLLASAGLGEKLFSFNDLSASAIFLRVGLACIIRSWLL